MTEAKLKELDKFRENLRFFKQVGCNCIFVIPGLHYIPIKYDHHADIINKCFSHFKTPKYIDDKYGFGVHDISYILNGLDQLFNENDRCSTPYLANETNSLQGKKSQLVEDVEKVKKELADSLEETIRGTIAEANTNTPAQSYIFSFGNILKRKVENIIKYLRGEE